MDSEKMTRAKHIRAAGARGLWRSWEGLGEMHRRARTLNAQCAAWSDGDNDSMERLGQCAASLQSALELIETVLIDAILAADGVALPVDDGSWLYGAERERAFQRLIDARYDREGTK